MVEILKSTDVQSLLNSLQTLNFVFVLSKINIQTPHLQWSISIQIYSSCNFCLPNDNFFLFYFVFIGMLQGSSQVSGSTRISLTGICESTDFETDYMKMP